MHYLARNIERRLDPRALLPGARSIIVVAMNYYADAEEGPGAPRPGPDRAIFARYARGDDYHDVMAARLKSLLAFLKERAGEAAEGRIYVDAGPILEREVARRAGIGWFGKNTMLINTRRGSYFFLGEIVTNVALEPDEPAVGGCGTCTRCLEACPTGALFEPYKLDARLCISYLTIELKGAIPEGLRPALSQSGARVFGCDICQEVCPFNLRRSAPTSEPAFQPRQVTTSATLAEMMSLSEDDFRAKFKGSPVKRAKRGGLLRNAAAALQIPASLTAFP
jgi:epoxyqueuosine reductase